VGSPQRVYEWVVWFELSHSASTPGRPWNGSAYQMEGPLGLARTALQPRRGFHIVAGWVLPSGGRDWAKGRAFSKRIHLAPEMAMIAPNDPLGTFHKAAL